MTRNPKNLFFIDGTAAMLSVLLLGVVLVHFESYIGMPISILYSLAVMAAVFTIYSFSCYFFIKKNWEIYLRIIAIANSLYCITSIIVMVYYFDLLTTLGIIYFLGEFAIIILIVRMEIKVISGHFPIPISQNRSPQ